MARPNTGSTDFNELLSGDNFEEKYAAELTRRIQERLRLSTAYQSLETDDVLALRNVRDEIVRQATFSLAFELSEFSLSIELI